MVSKRIDDDHYRFERFDQEDLDIGLWLLSISMIKSLFFFFALYLILQQTGIDSETIETINLSPHIHIHIRESKISLLSLFLIFIDSKFSRTLHSLVLSRSWEIDFELYFNQSNINVLIVSFFVIEAFDVQLSMD